MKIFVEISDNYTMERDYIVAVILRDFLHLDVQTVVGSRDDVRLTTGDGPDLVVADCLFQTPAERWLTPEALPKQPLQTWRVGASPVGDSLLNPDVPVIYGEALANGTFCQVDERGIRLGLDVFGSAFFMLTRYEELVTAERDAHERMPATAALAYQEGFLDRPIVNEYVEILWNCLKRLWPHLERGPRAYQATLSHDVDHPLSVADKPWPAVVRNAGGDLVHRRDPILVSRRLYARLVSASGQYDADPNNTFDFILETSERHGLRSAFYFITDHSAGAIDGDYSIEMPWLRKLMRTIHERGHEIGLHPSYNTFRDVAQTKREFDRLLRATEEEGIEQDEWGGRQHYLRWDASTTWRNWADVGLHYDSTMTFADHVGFRCGVCYAFRTFDLRKREPLRLVERPLIVMEATLFERAYMRRSPEDGLAQLLELAATCKFFNGEFTLLWHNSSLVTGLQKRLYTEAIEGIA